MATKKSTPSRYHAPPLEDYPRTVDFLGTHGFGQEEFADWLVEANAGMLLGLAPPDEVQATAELFVRVRNEPESIKELISQLAAQLCIHQARKGEQPSKPVASANAATATRKKRERVVDQQLQRVTRQLRELSDGAHTIDEARRVRDRYARAIGAPIGVGGDVLVGYLMSSAASKVEIEAIDSMVMSFAEAQTQIGAARIAANVTARARGR